MPVLVMFALYVMFYFVLGRSFWPDCWPVWVAYAGGAAGNGLAYDGR
jgi:hypothetical protein